MSNINKILGKTITETFQVTSGATNNYILTSDVSGNATWQAPIVSADTNFANTDLTFTGNRTHDTNDNWFWLYSSPTGSTLYVDNVEASIGYVLGVGGNSNFTSYYYSEVQHYWAGYSRMHLTSGETTFNQDGIDIDFRIESDSDASMFFVDGGLNRIGIGTSSPSEKLDVSGKTKTTNFQMTSGATPDYILKSDSLGNASWSPLSGITGSVGKYTTNLTFTSSETKTVTHNLNTKFVHCSVWDSATDQLITAQVVRTSGNINNALDITISTAGNYDILITG